ncbi:hypothetical protein HDU93_000509 [Gonapodya sp. JEL0774]|nr:hypothetical protein HDU93_000509 [Gonapodya sp. JEL0774]
MPVVALPPSSAIHDIEDAASLMPDGDGAGSGAPYRVSMWEVASRPSINGAAGVRRRKTKTVKTSAAESAVLAVKTARKEDLPTMEGSAAPSENDAKDMGSTAPDFVLPGSHSVYVRTWGCSHNSSDAEYMSGMLAKHGHPLVLSDTDANSADVWLLNSCTVKGPSEASFLADVNRARRLGKKVIVSGCVPQASSRDKRWDGISIIGVQQIDRVVEVVEETIKGNCVQTGTEVLMELDFGPVKQMQRFLMTSMSSPQLLRDKKPDPPTALPASDGVEETPIPMPRLRSRKAGGAPLDLPKVRRNALVEIVPINTGCKTKFARGDLGSYAPEAIVARVEHVLRDEGVTEIWITSEDVGAWGADLGLGLPDLLRPLALLLPKYPHAMLRLGMANPPHIRRHLPSLIEFLNHPQVYSFIHIPVQSGSDKVLHDMRREYTAEGFWEVVDGVKDGVEGVTVATDVICGFPTETAEDHEDTLKLVRRLKPPVLHISQFYPRPGTPAARMKPTFPDRVKKERSREVTQLFDSYKPYDGFEGRTVRCLVTDVAHDGVKLVGHDKSYRQIIVQDVKEDDAMADDEGKPVKTVMGRWCRAEIVRTGKFFLEGRIVGVEPRPKNSGRVEVEMDGDEVPVGGSSGVIRRPGKAPKKAGPPEDGPTYPALDYQIGGDDEEEDQNGGTGGGDEQDRFPPPEDIPRPVTPPPPTPQPTWFDAFVATVLCLSCIILLSIGFQWAERTFTERLLFGLAGAVCGVGAADWIGLWESEELPDESTMRQWS